MQLVDLVALVGAVVAAGISLPQFILVVRTKDTHGLSLTAWLLNLGGATAWLNHGFRVSEINMIWPNAWGIIAAMTVLWFLRRNGRYRSLLQLWPAAAIAAAVIGLDYLVGTAAFGFTIVGPQVYGMIRQAIALMRAPLVSGVSVTTWGFQVLCQLTWTIWGIMAHEPGTLIVSSISLVAASVTLSLRILRALGMGPIWPPKRRRTQPAGVAASDPADPAPR